MGNEMFPCPFYLNLSQATCASYHCTSVQYHNNITSYPVLIAVNYEYYLNNIISKSCNFILVTGHIHHKVCRVITDIYPI